MNKAAAVGIALIIALSFVSAEVFINNIEPGSIGIATTVSDGGNIFVRFWNWLMSFTMTGYAVAPPQYQQSGFTIMSTTVYQVNFTEDDTWEVPSGVTLIMVEAWGGGAAGAGQTGSSTTGSGGGGAYATRNISVTPGETLSIAVAGAVAGSSGDGANGTPSWVKWQNTSTAVYADFGRGGTATAGGAAGLASNSIGTIRNNGGAGAFQTNSLRGGGGGAGTYQDGSAATSGTGGAGGNDLGGQGGTTSGNNLDGGDGSDFGGGGGNVRKTGAAGTLMGGGGAAGFVRITYEVTVSSNTAPTWTVNLADSPDPVTAGNSITYTGTGTDSESDQYRLTVCKTDSITNGYPGTCTGTTLCTSLATNSGSEASCSYSTLSGDVGTLTAYAFLCDAGSSTCSASTSTTTTVETSYGVLSVSITSPSDNHEVQQYNTFAINATITCNGNSEATCGTVYAYPRYNATTASANTVISTSQGATPLFIKSGSVPQSSSLTQGQSMTVGWLVNASGSGRYEVDVLFNSSLGSSNIPDNNTEDRTVIISLTPNTPPSWTANLADSPDPVTAGNNVTYTGTGTDPQSDNYRLTVCRTNSITNGYPGACAAEQTLCTSSATSSGSEASCQYATVSGDVGTLTAYAFLCDAGSSTCSASTSTTTTVETSYGVLSVSITSPSDNHEVQQYNTFAINATITCNGNSEATCGTVYAYPRYNATTASANTVISTSQGATPLFIKSGSVPQSSSLTQGQSMTVGWLVNASGSGRYEVDVLFNSSLGSSNIPDNHTEDRTVVISLTPNTPPSWTANLADSPDPVTAGNNVTYTGTGTDPQSDNYRLTVCRTNSITNGYPGACAAEQTLCTSSATSSGSEASCQYATVSGDVGTLTAYAFLCDAGSSTCSASTSTTTTVEAANTPPTITTPTFNPSSPTADNNIECRATPSDAESPTLTVDYAWYKNSVLHSSGTTTGLTSGVNAVINTLSSSQTLDGETWNCTVRAYDGEDYSSYASATVLVSSGNTAPSVTTPLIGPAILRDNANAVANTTYTDPQSDTGTVYFRWYVNKALVYTQTVSSVSSGSLAESTLTSGYYTSYDLVNVSVHANDGFLNSSIVWSATKTISPNVPTYSSYDGATTDFNSLPDPGNVNQPVLEKTGSGMIKWLLNSRNVAGADFDTYVTISSNLIEVDSANLHASLNSQANLTLYGLSYTNAPALYRDGAICGSYCTLKSYSGGTLKFNVSGFSGYSSGANSILSIWDETDSGMPYGGQTRILNEQVLFFANYTNATSGAVITGATCQIMFEGSWLSMPYNTTKLLYQYNRSFSSGGNHPFNATCSRAGFETLLATDTVTITDTSKFWNNTFDTTGKVLGLWDVTAAAASPWFFSSSLDTKRNFTLIAYNTPPVITQMSLTPALPNTTSNLMCNATVRDSESTSLTAYWYWYNSSTLMFSGSTIVQNNTNTLITTLGFGNTTKGESWNCTVRAFDGEFNSSFNSTAAAILNSPPQKPVLLLPTSGNETYHDRNPFFSWSATDADGDNLTHTINITFSSLLACGPDISAGTATQNYTALSEFCLDSPIYWQVRSFDGIAYSEWSDKWNFTVESYLSINLTRAAIDFGNINLHEIKDTDSGYLPLVIENIGNIVVNISRIGANHSLWSSVGLNTEYFQFKADNTSTLPNSFNWSGSTTTWENMTGIILLNKTIIRELHYNRTRNNAEIDIRVQVPPSEPPGPKRVTLYIMGEQS
jgi:hypothetical protein